MKINMIHEIKVPKLNVNDETVKIAQWYVTDGQAVKKGQPICALETSKSVEDLLSEKEGYVRGIKYEVGEEVPVQEIICYLTGSPDEALTDLKEREVSAAVGKTAILTKTNVMATQKAQVLAGQLGVDLNHIEKNSIIREKDVQEFYDSTRAVKTVPASAKSDRGPSIRQTITPENIPENFPRDFKIGAGSKISAARITIGEGVVIGENTTIEADEVILGRMVRIGRQCELKTGLVKLGDVTTLADRVIFDLSGGKTKSSQVVTGRQCLIAMEVYVNASRSVTLGDHAALSPRAMIFTHSFWQSVLQGYSAQFDDVYIEKDAWVGAAAQLLPGTRVGEGSIVMSNSLVASHVEAFSMVGGVPAVVIKKQIKKPLSLPTKIKILQSLLEEFASGLKDRGFEISIEDCGESFQVEQSKERLRVGIGFKNVRHHEIFMDLVKLEIFGPQNGLTEELREFLRRRGILFSPVHWRFDNLGFVPKGTKPSPTGPAD